MIISNALGGAFNEASPRRDSAGCFTSPPTSERMRVSPSAFFLEKAVKIQIKPSVATEYLIGLDGTLVIKQPNNQIELTYHQITKLLEFVAPRQQKIEKDWNDGIVIK